MIVDDILVNRKDYPIYILEQTNVPNHQPEYNMV